MLKIMVVTVISCLLSGCYFRLSTLDIQYNSGSVAAESYAAPQQVQCFYDLMGVRQCSNTAPTMILTNTQTDGYWSGGLYYEYNGGSNYQQPDEMVFGRRVWSNGGSSPSWHNGHHNGKGGKNRHNR